MQPQPVDYFGPGALPLRPTPRRVSWSPPAAAVDEQRRPGGYLWLREDHFSHPPTPHEDPVLAHSPRPSLGSSRPPSTVASSSRGLNPSPLPVVAYHAPWEGGRYDRSTRQALREESETSLVELDLATYSRALEREATQTDRSDSPYAPFDPRETTRRGQHVSPTFMASSSHQGYLSPDPPQAAVAGGYVRSWQEEQQQQQRPLSSFDSRRQYEDGRSGLRQLTAATIVTSPHDTYTSRPQPVQHASSFYAGSNPPSSSAGGGSRSRSYPFTPEAAPARRSLPQQPFCSSSPPSSFGHTATSTSRRSPPPPAAPFYSKATPIHPHQLVAAADTDDAASLAPTYRYDAPHGADIPGYFPPDSAVPNVVFDPEAPHHIGSAMRPAGGGRPGAFLGDEDHDELELDRETLKAFPKFARTWFHHPSSDGGDMRRSGGGPPHRKEEQHRPGLTGDLGERPPAQGADGEEKNLKMPHVPEAEDLERIKESRVRQLEREFGAGASRKDGTGGKVSSVESPQLEVGDVDARGRIVTAGPKLRMWLRIFEGVTEVATVGLALYPAFLLKVTLPPPPKGTLSAYVLYGFSLIALIAFLAFVVIRPLCCANAGRTTSSAAGGMHPGSHFVPLPPRPGGGGKGMGKKGKGTQPGFQINLLVDPRSLMLQPPPTKRRKKHRRKKNGARQSSDDFSSSSSDSDSDNEQEARGRPLDVMGDRLRFAEARRWIVKMLWFDAAMVVGWGVVALLQLFVAPKCPVQTFDGWCDLWNSTIACALALMLAFGTSFVLGCKDARLPGPYPGRG